MPGVRGGGNPLRDKPTRRFGAPVLLQYGVFAIVHTGLFTLADFDRIKFCGVKWNCRNQGFCNSIESRLHRLVLGKELKMRVTQHSGRTHRDGKTYSTKHNDRNFETEADNIDKSKTKDNSEWTWCQDKEPSLTFDKAELKFYEKFYQKQLDATNEKYLKGRHKEKVKTMDAWRKQKKHAPEEVLIQIGKVGERPDIEVFKKCFLQYLDELNKWNKEHGNCMHILDWALHQDELGAPHVHLRRVWDYYNKETEHLELGQEKALEAAGVELPKPKEAPGHFNNRKMTFDAEMRIVWQNIVKENGLEIETEPLPKNKVGMSLDQKIRQNEEERARLLKEAAAEKLRAEKEKKDFELKKEADLEEIEKSKTKLQEEIDDFADAKKEAEKILKQKTEIEKTSVSVTKEKEEWENSKLKTEEFVKSVDDYVEPLPRFETNKEIGTEEALKENFPLKKTGPFTHENHYEYARGILHSTWDWIKDNFYTPLQEKCNKLIQAVRDLKKENLDLRKRNSELENENKRIKNNVDDVVKVQIREQTKELVENAKKEAVKPYEEKLAAFNNFLNDKKTTIVYSDGFKFTCLTGKQSLRNMSDKLDAFENLTSFGFKTLAERMEKLKLEDGVQAYERMKKDGCTTLGEWLNKPLKTRTRGYGGNSISDN